MNNNYQKKLIGDFGEQLATDYLLKKGYDIIERNIKISHQEIDIIANINDYIVFVEVKTRIQNSGFGAEDALDSRKINNLKKAIISYSYSRFINIDCIQLDLIAVYINKSKKIAKIKHYKEIL